MIYRKYSIKKNEFNKYIVYMTPTSIIFQETFDTEEKAMDAIDSFIRRTKGE